MNSLIYHKAFSRALCLSVGEKRLSQKFSADFPLDLIRPNWGNRLISSYKESCEDNYWSPSWEARPVSKDKEVDELVTPANLLRAPQSSTL